VGDELEEDAEESWEDWERREGREKSVEEKAWLNQPERRAGRSPMRVVVDVVTDV
jgi:hypothetical protein